MAVTLTINGVGYTFPTTGDESWGSDVTNWATAVSNGTLQPDATLFTLTTGDLDFGNNFGLTALYLNSRSANHAASGVLRLSNTDSVAWRNFANSGDLLLGVDGSNNLTFNGTPIISGGGVIPATSGGTGQTSYTVGDTLYANSTTTLAKLGIGAASTVLVSTGSVPSWALLVNANIDAAAAVARTKLASGTPNYVLINDGAGVMSEEQFLAKSRGGSNQDNSGLTFPVTGTLATLAGVEIFTNKDIDGGTASNTSRITLPKDTLANLLTLTRKEATIVYATDTQKPYFDDGVTLQPIGSGSGGGGGFNYITNSDAETGTTPWATYKDAAQATPVDGTGGSPTHITLTSSPTNPLRGTKSFLMSNSGSTSAQGEGVSVDFTIDTADKAKLLAIQFDLAIASGTFQAGSNIQDSDVEIFIYDVTNTILIPVTPYKLVSNGPLPATFKAVFQTNSNSTSYRLILHVATTNTAAWALQFDNVSVGPQPILQAPSVSDWQSYSLTIGASTTPPTKGTTTLDDAKWRRVGDSMEINYQYQQTAAGSAGSGRYLFPLPPGYSIDTSKFDLAAGLSGKSATGIAGVFDGSVNFIGKSYAFDASNIAVVLMNQNTFDDFGSASGNLGNTAVQFALTARVPILGWSSNVVTGNDADARVVAASMFVSTTYAVSASNPIKYDTIAFDTHGAYNTATGGYTVPVSGKYELSASGIVPSSAGSLFAAVNTSSRGYITTVKAGEINSGSLLIDCVAGDVVQVYSDSTVTIQGSLQSHFSINRVSGPALPLESELVAARYKTSSGQSFSSGVATVVNFDTKDYDTHGAVVTGASWTFTAPLAGWYRIGTQLITNGAAWTLGNFMQTQLFVGVTVPAVLDYKEAQSTNSFTLGNAGSTTVMLNSGDIVQLKLTSQRTGGSVTLVSSDVYNYITIERIK